MSDVFRVSQKKREKNKHRCLEQEYSLFATT